jgi:TatD DNase family protein
MAADDDRCRAARAASEQPLVTTYVDTHCHLDRYPRPLDVLEAAGAANVTVVAVTEIPSAYQALAVKLGPRRGVLPALGFHPLRVQGASSLERSLFDRLLIRAHFVGEVGLDFSREGQASRRRQLQTFESILALPAIRSKVMTVHSRRAEPEAISLLTQAGAVAILHWYSGAVKHVDAALAAGMCFSVNPAMLVSTSGGRVLAAVPPDRVLIETDGPYVRQRGRPTAPTDVPAIVASLARRWGMTPTEAATRIGQTWAELNERASDAS